MTRRVLALREAFRALQQANDRRQIAAPSYAGIPAAEMSVDELVELLRHRESIRLAEQQRDETYRRALSIATQARR